MKIYTIVSEMYSHSMIHRIGAGIKTFIKNLSRDSMVVHFFTADSSLIKKSVVYKIYRGLMRVIDYVIVKLNRFFKRLNRHSGVAGTVTYYNSNTVTILRLIYQFLLFSGVGIVLMNIFAVKTSYGFKLGGGLALLGLIGLFINGREARILKNSVFASFVGDLFKLDEGGEHWW